MKVIRGGLDASSGQHSTFSFTRRIDQTVELIKFGSFNPTPRIYLNDLNMFRDDHCRLDTRNEVLKARAHTITHILYICIRMRDHFITNRFHLMPTITIHLYVEMCAFQFAASQIGAFGMSTLQRSNVETLEASKWRFGEDRSQIECT